MGEKARLSAALDTVQGLDLVIPVIAIAKREEEVYVPGEMLPRQARSERDGAAVYPGDPG